MITQWEIGETTSKNYSKTSPCAAYLFISNFLEGGRAEGWVLGRQVEESWRRK